MAPTVVTTTEATSVKTTTTTTTTTTAKTAMFAAMEAKTLVKNFDLNSDRSKRDFFKAIEKTSEPLMDMTEVKEFYQVSFEMIVDKLANEFNILQLQNAQLSSQLLSNSEKLDAVLFSPPKSSHNCSKFEQIEYYNPCYDPKFADLFHILGNAVGVLFNGGNNNNSNSNNMIEPQLSFLNWFNPQSAGITVSAVCTVIFCFFDQRIASYLSKKYNIKIKSVTKVSFNTKKTFQSNNLYQNVRKNVHTNTRQNDGLAWCNS